MADPTIKGVCAEARRYNFQLFSNFDPIPIASSDEYMDQCQKIFEDAKAFQRRVLKKKPKLPTAAHIRQIGKYATKHKLGVIIKGYDVLPGSALAMMGTMICVRPRNAFVVPLSRTLDHEFGHVRDKRLIAAYAPALKSAMKKIKLSESEMRLYISTIMKLMREGLSQSDQLKYDKLRKEMLGDLDQYDARGIMLLIMCFAELFRAGEEILDERFESAVKDLSFGPLKKDGPTENYYRRRSITNHKGERVDLCRVLYAAMLQEAVLWERFTQLPDYDPNSIRYIQPNHLKFFRLCIRGATRYFINTVAR